MLTRPASAQGVASGENTQTKLQLGRNPNVDDGEWLVIRTEEVVTEQVGTTSGFSGTSLVTAG